MRECAAPGLIRPGEVRDGTAVRAEMAYPVYDREYQRRVKIIRDYLAHFANLQTIGRNGLHRHNNMDHSMLARLYAARNVLGEALWMFGRPIPRRAITKKQWKVSPETGWFHCR
jgi:protoporphyrinogen oxidase